VSGTASFVVVNFNGRDFLEPCLESILAQTVPASEVIVVDNGSSDDSVSLVRGREPAVRLIEAGRNLGFPAACNRGIKASSGELVAILNNDIVLHPQWLENLLKYDREPWDFWASRIMFAREPTLVDSAGDGMAVVGAGFKVGYRQPASRFDEVREVFGPCAAAALYRRSMLEALGGFDPDFFLVYEDADLSMRARLRGHRCLYVPEAMVCHHVNSSIRSFSETYVYYGHRNSEFLFWQNMPALLLLLYLPERAAFNLLSFAFFASRGRGGAFIRAKLDVLRSWRRILVKRRSVQRDRRVTSRVFRRILERNWLKHRRKGAVNP
jgi:GT2 family glycosyltransferase